MYLPTEVAEHIKDFESQIIVAYNETFADGLPKEMTEGAIIRKFLEDYFPDIIKTLKP